MWFRSTDNASSIAVEGHPMTGKDDGNSARGRISASAALIRGGLITAFVSVLLLLLLYAQ